MKNKKVVLLSVFVLVIAFIIGSVLFKENKKDDFKALAKNSASAPFVQPYSPSFGKNEKKVTIVEFVDPECGACRAFHGVVKKVYSDYENEVKLVIRYLANHKNSEYMVRILEASRIQNKYKEVEDIIFFYQPKWAEENSPKPKLIWNFLPQIKGLDVEKLRADFDTIDISKILKQDRADAKELGVRGTPTFFVNGKELETLSYQTFDDLVVSEIYK